MATISGTARGFDQFQDRDPRRSGAGDDRVDLVDADGDASVPPLGVRNGMWTYTSTTGAIVSSSVRAGGGWHDC